MKVVEYNAFVRRTDQYAKKPIKERHAIAIYGLVGEIGSLVSAAKKKILAEGGETGWDQPTEEMKEEIGDVLWYCFSLAQISGGETIDILGEDIECLRREIDGHGDRAEKIRAALDPSERQDFLDASANFPPPDRRSFDDYQQLAFKTSRTDGHTLLEVCLAVLPQLGAELLRVTLPDIELILNRNVADRPANKILGEIAWHLAAISSLYHLSLDEVVRFNREKVSFRAERSTPTPLHDDGRPPREQFPRQFDVAFVRVGAGRSRMYFDGRRLGDDLTDNAREDDGYRFHDVLHLALIAHLGWSPVFRGMMKRKRPDVDQVQDSGRAKVVEELVLKAVHSEGERQARESGRCPIEGSVRLFPDSSTITFRLLKTLRTYVEGLEVWNNAYWEWEDAICDGCNAFFQLRTHRQGTVHVDLENRRLTFTPVVAPNVTGSIVMLGLGTATVEEGEKLLSGLELERAQTCGMLSETLAAKRALLRALDFEPLPSPEWNQLEIEIIDRTKVSVKASGLVQDQIWTFRAVDYKVSFVTFADQTLCTLIAIADTNDLDP